MPRISRRQLADKTFAIAFCTWSASKPTTSHIRSNGTAKSKRSHRYKLLALILFLSGCSAIPDAAFRAESSPASTDDTLESVVRRVHHAVERSLDSSTRDAHLAIVNAHRTVDAFPARHMRQPVVRTLMQPWDGLVQLETRGRHAADAAARGIGDLPSLLALLAPDGDKASPVADSISIPTGRSSEDLLAFMVDTIHLASVHRNQALAALSEQDRQFLFSHGQVLAERYIPQISILSNQTMADITEHARFAELLDRHVDLRHLTAAALVLARLTSDSWLNKLPDVFHTAVPASDVPAGVTGDILLVHRTPEGIIVIGGPGPNTYNIEGEFALLIDLGGDDHYHGFIAASHNDKQGNAVVIDLSGHDTYNGAPLGLATGRLGIGLLFDRAGDDTYALRLGSGGVGFGGLGILFDAEGHDTYSGERMTQGVAIGGLGLLVDGSGDDRYTSHGYAIGFGGPLGVGSVIDVAGHDTYQCGNAIPSAYNAEDAPNGKPGDPLFQYDCFGLGVGAGFRVLVNQPQWRAKSLAGGWGLLADLDGSDQYHSANFSQGMGYFFGAGTLLDLDGHDLYEAARYGHGASAHHGVGLFIDRSGHDRYGSTGPYYNAGVAWDHGVSLAIDGGAGDDIYAFDRTTGLGAADHMGWAVFVDEGGDDQYRAQSGLGEASSGGVAVFLDRGGNDRYQGLSLRPDVRPDNDTAFSRPNGGYFIDRQAAR